MPSENVPAWAMEKAREVFAKHGRHEATYYAVIESVARALASAHAAGEEKGRSDMREEAARVLEHSAFVESFEREVVAIRTLPTTPPTPNPLPATGGEEK